MRFRQWLWLARSLTLCKKIGANQIKPMTKQVGPEPDDNLLLYAPEMLASSDCTSILRLYMEARPEEATTYISYEYVMDPFPKPHRLVHNGGFPKFETLYCSLYMGSSTEISQNLSYKVQSFKSQIFKLIQKL